MSRRYVKKIRQAVQIALSLGITDAQDWCSTALHTSRRAFQQWEAGDRQMHKAFYELLTMKLGVLQTSLAAPQTQKDRNSRTIVKQHEKMHAAKLMNKTPKDR